MSQPVPIIVIVGNHNGVGKTSLSVAIIVALRRRGLTIQPFKMGPEVGDALHLSIAAERDCVMIDGWALDAEKTLGSFSRHTQGCDLAVVEGHHDLFDGIDGASDQGSTSHIAKLLGAPVLLVFNFWTLTASAAVKGFLQYDRDLHLAGVLLNNVVEEPQLQQLRANYYRSGVNLELLANVPRVSGGVLPPAFECGAFVEPESELPEFMERLADLAEQHVDLDRVLAVAAASRFAPKPLPRVMPRGRVRIAVSRDAAFCIAPAENLRLLQESGADLVYFSPLSGRLPTDVAAIYLTHGYPERYTAQLSNNWATLAGIQAFASAGGPVYAENGGLMYLSQSLQPEAGTPCRMVGVFPFRTRVTSRLNFGYVEVEVTDRCPIFPRGARARGHYLHYSETVQERVLEGLGLSDSESSGNWQPGYRAAVRLGVNKETKIVDEGYSWLKVFGSYVQLNFASNTSLAACFVDRCREVDVAALTRVAQEAVQVAATVAPALTPTLDSGMGMRRTHPVLEPFTVEPAAARGVDTPSRGRSPVRPHANGGGNAADPLSPQRSPPQPPRMQASADRLLFTQPIGAGIDPILVHENAAYHHLQRSARLGAQAPDEEGPHTPGGTPLAANGRYNADIRRVLFEQNQDGTGSLDTSLSAGALAPDQALWQPLAAEESAPPPFLAHTGTGLGLPSLNTALEGNDDASRLSSLASVSRQESSGLVSFGSVSFAGPIPYPTEVPSPARAPLHSSAFMSSPIRGVTMSPNVDRQRSPLSGLALELQAPPGPAPTPVPDPGQPSITLRPSQDGTASAHRRYQDDRSSSPPLDLGRTSRNDRRVTIDSSLTFAAPTMPQQTATAWQLPRASGPAHVPSTPFAAAPPLPATFSPERARSRSPANRGGRPSRGNGAAPSVALPQGTSRELPPTGARFAVGSPTDSSSSRALMAARHARTKSNPFLPDGSLASSHGHVSSSWGNTGPPTAHAHTPNGFSRNNSGLGGSTPSMHHRASRSRLNLQHLSHEEMIVAVGPTAAEIIAALGLGDRLVGISEDCSYPPDVRKGREVVARPPGTLLPPPHLALGGAPQTAASASTASLALHPSAAATTANAGAGGPLNGNGNGNGNMNMNGGMQHSNSSRMSRPFSADVFHMSRDASAGDLTRASRDDGGAGPLKPHRQILLSFDRILHHLHLGGPRGGGHPPRRGDPSSEERSARTSADSLGVPIPHFLSGAPVSHLWGKEVDREASLSVLDLEWFRRELPGLVVVERPEHAQQLKELYLGIHIVEICTRTLHGTLDAILTLGRAAGASHVASPLVDQLRGRLRKVASRSVVVSAAPLTRSVSNARASASSSAINGAAAANGASSSTAAAAAARAPAPLGPPRKVVVVKHFKGATGEILVGGLHLPELVSLAGGRTAQVHAGDPDQLISWDDLRRAAPEVLIFSPASLPTVEHALLEVSQLAARAGWWSLPAVFHGETYLLSPHAAEMINRPGPRVADGADFLARILRPVAPQVGPGGKSTRLQGFSSSREGKNAFVLKLDLKGGGRCRPKALANYFVRIA